MKRLLSLAALFLCCLATTFAQFTGSGSGTENDPYLILNPIQLNQLRNFLNMGGVYFKLMADIDLTEYLEDENPDQGWQPVGNSSASFNGVLDGNEKTIRGLWINRSNTDYVGLFGYCSSATIKNLKIEDADIRGKMYVGVVSGYQYGGSNSNCVLSGKVNGTGYVGGCTGVVNEMNFSGISSSVDVIGGDFTGGIAGQVLYHICSVSNCYVNSSILGNNKTGGVVGGEVACNNMSNCGFVGSVTGTSNVGGICGSTYSSSSKKNCYAVAFVSGTNENIGGLIGNNHSTVEDCYFSGSVAGKKYTGGLIGYNESDLPIRKSYSHGSVTGSSYVGGLFGYISYSGSIQSNVVIASSIKATEGYVGRLYGYNRNTNNIGTLGTSAENKSYNRTIVISQGVAQDISDDIQNGTGVSATTLKLKATYVAMGWDFNSNWAIQETECYPYMQRQTAPPVITSNVVSNSTSISGKCIDGGTITLEVDGTSQQMIGTGHTFLFNVSPLQAGHEVRISARADGKEPSYFTTETVSYLGKGTESDPYQIYTAADLTGVYRKGYFKLMNDIDLTDYINQFSPTEGWESIGREGSETIHFDGDGHKITGLWCNSTRDNTGLFSCFANGTIKNLTVKTAQGKQVKGGANTGIIIGKMMNGTIENCSVEGTVSDGTPVGGLVGLFDGGTISRCQAKVTINTTLATSYVGGLVGEITGGTIDQCFTEGTLTGTGSESYVGGLIGKNQGTLTNCYSTAVINSSYNAAGLVAYNYGLVDKCYAMGNLYSNNYAAGIIGYNDGANAVVSNCVAMNNKIEVVYESQQVQQGGGYGQRIIGGIKNGAPAPEMNNDALKTMQVSVNDVPQKVYDDIMNGTAKTSAELKQKSTYQALSWDFTNIWNIDEGEGYPFQTVQVSGGSDPTDPDDPNSGQDIIIYDLLAGASENNPADATILIKNANFEQGNIEGWNITGGIGDNLKYQMNDGTYDYTLPDGTVIRGHYNQDTGTWISGFIEAWRPAASGDLGNGTISQTIKGLPAGKYSFECDALACDQGKGKQENVGVYLFAEGGGVSAKKSISTASERPEHFELQFVSGGGDITLGLMTQNTDANWMAADNFKLRYYGNPQGGVEVTDISQLDNAIYIEPVEARCGTQVTLSVKMKNSVAVQTIQFDLYLPDGVSVIANDDDELITASKERIRKYQYFNSSIQSDGALRLLAQATTTNIAAGDGEICMVTVGVPDDMEEGEYPILFKEMRIVGKDNTNHSPSPNLIQTKLVVSSYIPGDANGDGEIDAIDFNIIGNHILGFGQSQFNEKAADINGDGEIDAIDFNMVANYILYGSYGGASASRVFIVEDDIDPS